MTASEDGGGREGHPGIPTLLGYPDRARALRPAGMVEAALTWGMGHQTYDFDFCETHLWVASVDARVPIDELVLEASFLQATVLHRYTDLDREIDGTYMRFGSPRLGASWRTQGDGWRAEVGGAFSLPVAGDATVHRSIYPTAGGHAFIWEPSTYYYSLYRGGWNAFQLQRHRLALIAHTRWELDPSPHVVLGAVLDVPIVLELDQSQLAVLPQIAVEGAWRFWGASLLGLRAQLVTTHAGSYLPGGGVARPTLGAVALLEPFIRLVALLPDASPYVTASLQVTLGPDQPTSFQTRSCVGVFGLKLGGGVLF